MPRKPAPKPDDPEQAKEFIKTAREIGADETRKGFEQAFKKVVQPKKPASKG